MIKTIFKILWIILTVIAVLLSLFFLFGMNGIEILDYLFKDGLWNGIKDFFVLIWEGFKSTVGL